MYKSLTREQTPRRSKPAWGRIIFQAAILLAVVGLILLLGYGVFFGTGGRVRSGVVVNSNAANVRVLQRPANDFSLKLFRGEETFRLSNYRGQVVVVNFWASWCVPCREEAPVLEQAWRTYKDRGVIFVGVDIWDVQNEAKRFVQQFGVTYPNGYDPQDRVAVDYGITGIPETFFITRDGAIASKAIGILSETTLAENIEKLLR